MGRRGSAVQTGSLPRSTVALSQANREAILQALLDSGPLSQPELAELLGVSLATINRLVSGLTRQGIVVSAGQRGDTGGRPSRLVDIDPQAIVTVAVGIGRYTTRTAIVDLAGGISHVVENTSFASVGPQARLEEAIDMVNQAVASIQGHRQRCVAVGVAIPGSVLPDGVVDWAPGLEWRSLPLGPVIAAQTGLPVMVENDANVFAFFEHRQGAMAGASCVVSLLLTTRISVGIMVDGRLFRGAHSAAGEVGHLLVGKSSLERLYPQVGDLDARVGAAGVTARYETLTGSRLEIPTNVGEVCELADQGDPHARIIAAELVDELALTIGNLAVILDPDAVILCGRIGDCAHLIVPLLEERLIGRIPRVPAIVGPSTGPDPWLSGVGVMAREACGTLTSILDGVG